MNIKQIRTDYENGTVIGRATWAELLAHAEQADAVLNGRQQKIGEQAMAIATLECRIRTLEQDCRDWERAHKDAVSLPRQASNPAAHDWAAPNATIDSDEFRKLLFALAQDWTRSDRMSVLIAYIDARIAEARMVDKRDAERLEYLGRRNGFINGYINDKPAVRIAGNSHWYPTLRAAIDAIEQQKG